MKGFVRGLQKARRGGDSVVALQVYGRARNWGFEEDGAGEFPPVVVLYYGFLGFSYVIDTGW